MVAYGFHLPLNPKIKLKRYPVQIDFLDPITPEMYANMSTVEVAQYVQDLIEKRSAEMIVKDQLLLKQTSR